MRASKYDVLREVWKSVAVPSIMYGMDVIAWNENEIDRLEVGQNRVARMALKAPRYTAVEALRGDMGWSTFKERVIKSTLRYKIRLERMADERLARKVYLWNESGSKWRKRCRRMTERNRLQVVWGIRMAGRNQDEREWIVTRGGRVGAEWDVRKWKSEIDREVKRVGLNTWKNGMERKSTMVWYKEKEAPMYESWYDGSLGGDLLFRARAQCMDVNERNYRWSESRSKVCQMCNMGEDESVEHVVLECEKYERDRMEMMQVILTELGHGWDERVEKTGREWMVLLLGLCRETNARMIEAVKEFLEKMWRARCREH